MPNHTANNFTITGPKDTVLAFIERAKETNPDELDPQQLSLNSFIPMPSELKHTTSPTRIQTQEEIDATWAEWKRKKAISELGSYEQHRPFGLGLTRQQYDELISKYGATNWYDWSVLNWGTKWDCYDVREWIIAVADEEMTATIYYETAWSPATQVWLTVSQQYPTLTFFHEYADEGGGFLGDETIHNGTVIEENEYDWDSDDGITLREGLGRYWPEDEEVTTVEQ